MGRLVLLPFILVASLSTSSHALKLELASVLFRHGDRSPTAAYPNDPYQEDHWPQGFGQLSLEGMRQEYFLGTILRHRYVEEMKLLHRNYTRVQVYVRSTDVDRTLMSAESLLAGLFPPGENQIFNSTIPWQPIPVHTIPRDEDKLLLGFSVNCPTYKQLREDDTKTQAYLDLEKENKAFFKDLEVDTGYKEVNLSIIHHIYDILFVEQTDNLTLPSWVNATVMDRLLNLTLFTSSLMFNSLTKKQITAGNWVGKVMGDMMDKKDNPKEDIKLYLYSAHDTTVAAMLSALGVFNGEPPPYAATVFIELYSDDKGYWVSLFYHNETDSNYLMPLSVDSCDNPTLCTLDEFAKLTSPIIPADWEKECGLNSTSSCTDTSTDPTVIALASLLGVCVLLVIALTVVCVVVVFRSSRRRFDYSPLPKQATNS